MNICPDDCMDKLKKMPLPISREPRTAEARSHRARVAAVMESVAEAWRSLVLHRLFLAISLLEEDVCITSGIGRPGTDDGRPVASNNGVERDEETQRLTVNCSNKDCKKRQCKAMKSSFTLKDPASMSDALLDGIIALMRETNESMEKSLGDVLISSRCKNGKSGKGKGKDAFNGCKGCKGCKNSQVHKCKNVGKGNKDSAMIQRAVKIAIPKPAAALLVGGKKGRGQPKNRQSIQERWRSEFQVNLSGWHRPKRITFLLAKQPGLLLNPSNLHVTRQLEKITTTAVKISEEKVKAIVKPEPESENSEDENPPVKLVCAVPRVEMGSVGRMKLVKTIQYSGLQKTEPKLGDFGFRLESAGSWESEVHEEEEGDQGSSLTFSHIDEPPSWTSFDEGDSSMGFKHDPWQLHGMNPGNRLPKHSHWKNPLTRPLSSAALSRRASPLLSPVYDAMGGPPSMSLEDKIITDMEPVQPGVVCVDHLRDNSEFQVKEEFDGNEVSSMSTELDYVEANSWHGTDVQEGMLYCRWTLRDRLQSTPLNASLPLPLPTCAIQGNGSTIGISIYPQAGLSRGYTVLFEDRSV